MSTTAATRNGEQGNPKSTHPQNKTLATLQGTFFFFFFFFFY
jgi:hypothetical protein